MTADESVGKRRMLSSMLLRRLALLPICAALLACCAGEPEDAPPPPESYFAFRQRVRAGGVDATDLDELRRLAADGGPKARDAALLVPVALMHLGRYEESLAELDRLTASAAHATDAERAREQILGARDDAAFAELRSRLPGYLECTGQR